MADPIADNADLAVDELKRKARRRLVGAIVLALAAATILPLLLEQDQKPLGDDIAVRIPPIDDGKFVSRLPMDKGKEAAAPSQPGPATPKAAGKIADTPSAPAAAPASVAPPPGSAAAAADDLAGAKQALADAEQKLATSPAKGGQAQETKAAKADAKNGAAPAAVEAKAAPTVAAQPPPAAADAKASPAAPAAPTATPPRADGFSVQLGAFTDNYGANALANKLKKSGYPAYTEPVETSRGTLWRVRVGSYPTREAAVDVRNKLKVEGHNGIVSAAK